MYFASGKCYCLQLHTYAGEIRLFELSITQLSLLNEALFRFVAWQTNTTIYQEFSEMWECKKNNLKRGYFRNEFFIIDFIYLLIISFLLL